MGAGARFKFPGLSRKRLWTVGPFALALAIHLVLLLLIISWRAPAMAMAPVAGQVSLFPAPGKAFATKIAQAAPLSKPEPAEKATSTPSTVSTVLESGAVLSVRPAFDPPSDLEPILVNVVTGGAPPQAEPLERGTAPAIDTPTATTLGGGKTCQLFDQLQNILQSSDQVRRALPLIPQRARSVANAVMLWDGHWLPAQAMGGPSAFDPIQAIVLQAILSAPPSCRVELVRGPRLIAISNANDTIVLAFGSGEWRWSDLLSTSK